MKIQCEYCGNWIEDTDENCSYCGAPNENLKRYINKNLDTIEELKQWYKENYFPSEEITRFFIGKNYKKEIGFGIYKKGDNFIVYQNKDDGSRTIFYNGPDEAYAVNIIALELRETVLDKKVRNLWRDQHPANAAERKRNSTIDTSKGESYHSWFIFKHPIAFVFILGFCLAFLSSGLAKPKHKHYYASSPYDIYYYYDHGMWDEWWKYEQGYWKSGYYDTGPGLFPPGISGYMHDFANVEEIEKKYNITVPECDMTEMAKDKHYYAVSAYSVYYCSYNTYSIDWYLYREYGWEFYKKVYSESWLPDGIEKNDYFRSLSEVNDAFGTSIPDCESSVAFFYENPEEPIQSYYFADDQLWYYVETLSDSYGKIDSSGGWYRYDETEKAWIYASRYNEPENLPEDLFLYSGYYMLTDNYDELQRDYSYIFPDDYTWSESMDFTTSEAYEYVKQRN